MSGSDSDYKSDSSSSDDEVDYVDAEIKKTQVKTGVEDEYVSDESVADDDDDELSEDDDSDDNDEFGFMENGETQPVKTARKKKTQPEEPNHNYIEYEDNGDIDDDDMDDDDADGAEYMRKFDENTRKNVISEHHPELFQHNTDEIEALCLVARDNHGIIVDPLHRTLPFLTKYERARILGERAKQLNAGATPVVSVSEDVIDGYLIALKELEQKAIPFIIKRPLLNGGCEYWKLQDLELI
jgi:DNA-directed RNA polymerase subunit K/omega